MQFRESEFSDRHMCQTKYHKPQTTRHLPKPTATSTRPSHNETTDQLKQKYQSAYTITPTSKPMKHHMHRWRWLLRLTLWRSLRVRLYTSSNPTVSLCESSAINYESTTNQPSQKAFKSTHPTPTSTNFHKQTSIKVIVKTTTAKQPPRRKNHLLNLPSHRYTRKHPSHQKSHAQITKTQTNPISKLRVDGEFTGWHRGWERGILLYPSEQNQSQPKNTAPHINF